MSDVRVLVLSGYGLNCDHETAYAFELAGAEAERVHINALIDGDVGLDDFQILTFIGGFSWGDDHGAGVIQAVRMKMNLGDALLDFIGKGNLVLGICNGFQTLVNLGLLPGLDGDYRRRSVALTGNDSGNFRDDWVTLAVNDASPCVFTKGIRQIDLPIRHGEGKFYAEKAVTDRMENDNLVALRYALPDGAPANGQYPENPNGSIGDIAGICDPTGRIFGLMPHPEADNHPVNHPEWARRKEQALRSGKSRGTSELTPGVMMLKNGVDYIRRR